MSAPFVQIAHRTVGEGFTPLIVAEVGQAHEGSSNLAHDYIDAVADAGADAVKFQCHIAAAESYPDEPWRQTPTHARYGGETRFAYWRRMEFTPGEWGGLVDHAYNRGILFLCSVFSDASVDLLRQIVPAWKLPSGELANAALLAKIQASRKPVIISTGMATDGEIASVVEYLGGYCPLILLHCVSEYPTPAARARLGGIAELRLSYPGTPIGLSDHSGNIYAGLAGAALGARLIEVHVTLSKATSCPDTPSSITMPELKQLVEGVGFIHAATQAIVPRSTWVASQPIAAIRELFTRRHLNNLEFRGRNKS